MIVTERCATVSDKIRRGTPGDNGLVYMNRCVVRSAKGGFIIYHKWIPEGDYRASLKRITGQTLAQRRAREVPDTLGLRNIKHRVRSAAHSLRFVNRRPRWYALEWLGCPLEVFRDRFSEMFQSDMSWQDTRSWHVDHVLPVAVFDWSNPLSPYVCGHWSNYQPLRPVDNSRKHMRLDVSALERVARQLPERLLPVVRDLAALLGKTKLPPILRPEGAMSISSRICPTRIIMYNIAPMSQEDKDLLASPPPCPTHTEANDFCCRLA